MVRINPSARPIRSLHDRLWSESARVGADELAEVNDDPIRRGIRASAFDRDRRSVKQGRRNEERGAREVSWRVGRLADHVCSAARQPPDKGRPP